MALRLMLLVVGFSWARGNTNLRFIQARPGENITINCSTTLAGQENLIVCWSLPLPKEVLFLNHHPYKLSIRKPFKGKVVTAGNFEMLSVTISMLTVNNSGLYWCKYVKFNPETYKLDETVGDGPVTMVHFTDPPVSETLTTIGPAKDPQSESGGSVRGDNMMIWVVTGLSACSVLLTSVVLCICVLPKLKKFHQRRGHSHPRPHDGVYEDMHPKLRQ